ncbi:hypothetical protein F511_30235 [Dorcoceras hygrometricum]|uniref:SGF29 C-terminal domain-containing protein n=1 Tax=Dorcoceras hygrometricum TaxID=472368 RepID=A0A2Z7A163_9LAMI|nr:hypothetical protein F511_30235 [Dorcoceras hygrometricum]
MSTPDIVGILENSEELDRLRKKQEEILMEINKMHKKLQSTPEVVEKPGDNSLPRLKMLYTQAKELSENEVNISTQLLGQLDALIPSGTSGQHRRKIGDGTEPKKKRAKTDSDVSRLSPSMRNHLENLANLKGEQVSIKPEVVIHLLPIILLIFAFIGFGFGYFRLKIEVAARVPQEDAGKDEWFVVKVIHFDKETREIEVLDEEPGDDEESGGQRKYKLPMSHIIPFPKRTDLSSSHDFPPGKHVLAVYPETTTLYKATVVQARKMCSIYRVIFEVLKFLCGSLNSYVLEFDDDEEDGSLPQRSVPFHRVVPLPEGYRQ